MPVVRLETKRVEKPWGRTELWPGFADVEPGGDPVGEIWFQVPGQAAEEPELLVKYLFTSEKLSIQVHPDDAAARAAGYPRGKDEAWVILAAEQHATIAVGMLEAMDRPALRAAAEDGSIADLVDWKTVKPDDVYYSPAGTVHAIGPGLTLIEVQQNIDLTYRLFDYGRPRELHLDDGVAASDPVPYVAPYIPREVGEGRTVLADGPAFVLERWTGAGEGTLSPAEGRPVWLVPVEGKGRVNKEALEAGGVWLADGTVSLALEKGIDLLIAYPGEGVVNDLWTRDDG